MNAEDADVSSIACSIISFYMRYNPQVDYGDFGRSAEFIKMLRRYDGVKYAAELESLTVKIVELERYVTSGRGGGGSQLDNNYLEARIHDKVREAIE